jgi:hypothetical protein
MQDAGYEHSQHFSHKPIIFITPGSDKEEERAKQCGEHIFDREITQR